VFLTDAFAYKLLKPVKFEFLDFSTLERRREACRNEIVLNRRLAESTYLDVVAVGRSPAGDFRWLAENHADGEAIEWLVKMRRLPADRMLDRLIAEQRLKESDLDPLAAKLLAFYRAAPALPIPPREYLDHVRQHVEANCQELCSPDHQLPPHLAQKAHASQLQLLALRPGLIEQRAAAGHIVDGHGDLRPEHICLVDPPAIFDCVEFSAEFRQVDVLDELAFLAMECDFLGAPQVGQRLIEAYEEQASDAPPPPLLPFYKAYRACVRAKVAALRARQADDDARATSLTMARRYLELAAEYAAAIGPPRLIVVRGVSGTGKSTLARELARRLGCELLQTDVVRQQLFGRPEERSSDEQAAVYQPERRGQVYEEMFRRAQTLLSDGVSVVLDGTFLKADLLGQARQAAAEAVVPLAVVECHCPPEVAKERISSRLALGRDASEAGPPLHDRQLEQREETPAELLSIAIDTREPLEKQVERSVAGMAE
jgi:uncharacterized protein